MNIKKFTANTTQEAIQMVKKEMGSEAVILRTRTIRTPGEGGGKGEKKIEVTAAIDYEASPEKSPHVPRMDPDWVLERWRHMERELKDLKETILSADAGALLRPEIYFNDALRTRYVNFKTFGLRAEIIRELMHECPDANGREEKSEAKLLQDSLSRVLARIKFHGNGGQEKGGKIFSFIGPTGVGKTTTLAKLAAIKAIKQGRRAALITLDTFKIAAVAQLQSYARIMGIPLEVAVGRSDLQKAIRRHRDCDLILIDTAGRSPNQEQAIAELKDLFSIPEEIHGYLVLSATAQYKNLLHADDRFGALPFKSYIFTKLDETEDASSMINFLISREKPVSYLTTGQEVPEDIERASRKKLASLLLTRMRDTANK
jgi:flagellar biosynthesis protein FlhF